MTGERSCYDDDGKLADRAYDILEIILGEHDRRGFETYGNLLVAHLSRQETYSKTAKFH